MAGWYPGGRGYRAPYGANKAGFSVFDKGDCLPRPGSYGKHMENTAELFVLLVSHHSALRVNFNHLFGMFDASMRKIMPPRIINNSSRTVKIKGGIPA